MLNPPATPVRWRQDCRGMLTGCRFVLRRCRGKTESGLKGSGHEAGLLFPE